MAGGQTRCTPRSVSWTQINTKTEAGVHQYVVAAASAVSSITYIGYRLRTVRVKACMPTRQYDKTRGYTRGQSPDIACRTGRREKKRWLLDVCELVCMLRLRDMYEREEGGDVSYVRTCASYSMIPSTYSKKCVPYVLYIYEYQSGGLNDTISAK